MKRIFLSCALTVGLMASPVLADGASTESPFAGQTCEQMLDAYPQVTSMNRLTMLIDEYYAQSCPVNELALMEFDSLEQACAFIQTTRNQYLANPVAPEELTVFEQDFIKMLDAAHIAMQCDSQPED